MNRRHFLHQGLLAGLCTPIGLTLAQSSLAQAELVSPSLRNTLFLGGSQIKIYVPNLKRAQKILFVADTHLTLEDQRDAKHQIYSSRMAGAHQKKKHFQSSNPTTPTQEFERTLKQAEDYDLLVLGGDILNFPSIKAVEWLMEKLSPLKTPWRYVAGNHDWHFEGMEGSSENLRQHWIQERLLPLYQGEDPFNQSFVLGEQLQILLMDNSTYTIQKSQTEFLKKELAKGLPSLLFQHIPFYAKGRSVGFGCGHPEWGAASDKNYKIERRERWAEAGHSPTTFEYRNAAIAAPNLLATFAGHIHQYSFDLIQGLPQFVTKEHASGAHFSIEILPA